MTQSALDLHLNLDQRDLYERTRALAAKTLAPIAAAGTPGRVNRPLVAALAEHGLLARLFERDEVSAIELCLIREGLARGSTEAETAFALQGLGGYPIVQAGSEALKDEWIPRVAAGTAVAAFALTEPDAGSDPAALSLHATPDGQGGYRLSGEKLWISNAPEADIYTVFARSEAATGARGLTAFAVPGDSEGLSGEGKDMLAAHAIGALTFDDVAVTADQVLGEPGAGFRVAMRTLDLFRPSVGAFAIGMARTALELATSYARERETFGKPLSEHQAVAHRLAELRAQTEAARLMVHQAALAHDAQVSDPGVAAMAKLLATEVAQAAVDAAVQFHGAVALEQGHPLEHLYRDVRAPRIYEGASEIQREIIARAMFRQAPQ
ncbi:MAG TPA: acyl-CoA dehydrogenase family protein [Solirubrobacteraceae bacterium]|nr:acyl-CoA dehydrogenase family protein [Solirubrobacteraceae bacterium]